MTKRPLKSAATLWAALGLMQALSCPLMAAYRPMSNSVPAGSVPSGVNYQGRLSDNGTPVNATKTMTFSLYDAAAGGNLLWTSGAKSVTVTNGIFGTVLTISTGALSGPSQKYVEIAVDATILSPREPLSAVPYALVAKTLEEALVISSVTVASQLVSSGTLSVATLTSVGGLAGITVNSSVFFMGGALGIGTTSPQTALDVKGAVTSNSSMTASAFFGDGHDLTNLSTAAYSLPADVVKTDVANTFSSSQTITDPSGLLVAGGSVTASAFFGDGHNLTNVNAANLTGKISTSVFNGGAALLASTQSFSGQNTFLNEVAISSGLAVAGGVVGLSSVTASAFFGDGNNLTNVNAANLTGKISTSVFNGNAALLASTQSFSGQDTFLNEVAISSNLAVAGSVVGLSSVTASAFFGDGNNLTNVNAANLTGKISTSVFNGSAALLASTQSFSGQDTFINEVAISSNLAVAGDVTGLSSVTASAFFGDASHLTGISAGALPAGLAYNNIDNDWSAAQTFQAGSSVTLLGNAFSIGVSTLFVVGGKVGVGTTNPGVKLHVYGDSQSDYGLYDTPLRVEGGSYSYIEIKGTNSQAGALFNRDGSTGWLTALDNNGNFKIAPLAAISQTGLSNAKDGSTGITVAANGNVGVGTTAPLYLLDVNGAIRSVSSVTASAFFGDGRNLTNLSTAAYSLPATVAQTDMANTFTSSQTIQGLAVQARSDGTPAVLISSADATMMFQVATSGHLETAGGVPSLTGCGAAPLGSVLGTDTAMKITIGGGAVTSCVVTFNAPYANAPICTVSDENAVTPTLVTPTTTITNVTLTASFSTGDVVNVICIGRR